MSPSDPSSRPGQLRVLALLPCFNEAGSIGNVLRQIAELAPALDTLVIDDCSTDDTYRIARAHSPTIRLSENLGIGGAVQTGLRYGYQHGYDLCIQVDGDGQHPPDQALKLVEAWRTDPANLIVGSRYLDAGGYRTTLSRRLGSMAIRWAIRLLFGQRVTDPTSGLRLMDRQIMALFVRYYPHDFPEPVSLARALRRGLRVYEAPVRMLQREQGHSSIRGLRTLAYMVRVLGHLLLIRFERPNAAL